MLTLLLVCAFSSTQVQKYLAWVYNKVSLPGDCHVASLLAMTKFFVPHKKEKIFSGKKDFVREKY